MPFCLSIFVYMDVSLIHRYIFIGRNDFNWYQDCENVFLKLFGKEKLELVCKLFAATSINTSLRSNITLFRRALYEIENNLPVGKYLPNIQLQLRQIREGKDLTGRKINSFAKAMSGDKNAVVVDIWLLRAFGCNNRYFRTKSQTVREGGATDRQYDKIEGWIRHEAWCMGIEPRQLSSMIWAGVRISTNGKDDTHYKDILERKLTNLFMTL